MADSPEERPDDPEESTIGSTRGVRAPEDGGWRLVSQGHYDRDDPDGLTVTIVEAVAEAEGVRPTAILDPPLYHSADTVEIEATLFGTDDGDDGHDAGSFEFTYREYLVVIRSDGWVLVHERVDP